MRTIGDIAASLSPGEREMHRTLIEECRARERNVKSASRRAQIALRNDSSLTQRIREAMQNVAATSVRVRNMVSDISLRVHALAFENHCRRMDNKTENP